MSRSSGRSVPEIVGILLAAGASARFGRPKLLAPLPGGQPLAEAAARTLISVLPQSIAVVRPGDSALAALFRHLGLHIVINSRPDRGMGASLALGVQTRPNAAGWVIALGDMPCIEPRTVQRVTDALCAGASLAAPRYDGQRGHPVGFSPRFYQNLAALSGDTGAGSILGRHARELVLLDVKDPGVHLDVDSPSDLPLACRSP